MWSGGGRGMYLHAWGRTWVMCAVASSFRTLNPFRVRSNPLGEREKIAPFRSAEGRTSISQETRVRDI